MCMFAARNSHQAGCPNLSSTPERRMANGRMGEWRMATGDWRMALGSVRFFVSSFLRFFVSSFLRLFVCSFVRSLLSRKRGSSSHPIRDSNQDFITHSAAESESERDSQTGTVFCSGRGDSSHHNPTSFQSFTNHFISLSQLLLAFASIAVSGWRKCAGD